MSDGRVDADDPRDPGVRALIAQHLEHARAASPPEDVHALEVEGLVDPAVSFFSWREDGVVLAIGALRMLDARHAEIKSMHTARAARGRGLGSAMLAHLVDVARRRGVERVSLETGTMEEFAAARRLYARAGFASCEPFGPYFDSPNSMCMTLRLIGADPTPG